jgi:hypothetical protein
MMGKQAETLRLGLGMPHYQAVHADSPRIRALASAAGGRRSGPEERPNISAKICG